MKWVERMKRIARTDRPVGEVAPRFARFAPPEIARPVRPPPDARPPVRPRPLRRLIAPRPIDRPVAPSPRPRPDPSLRPAPGQPRLVRGRPWRLPPEKRRRPTVAHTARPGL